MNIYEASIQFEEHNCKIRDGTQDITTTVKSTLEKHFAEFGLDISVNNVTNPEIFVNKYYETFGYYVIKGYNNGKSRFQVGPIETLSELKEKLEIYCTEKNKKPNFMKTSKQSSKGIYQFGFNKTGVPDFFVYKYDFTNERIVDAFFVEVKSENDGLRFSQFKWMLTFTLISTRIFWLTGEPIKYFDLI